MAIIKSVRTMFHFVVSEANDWRSRDEVDVAAPANAGDPESSLPAATILAAGATAADPLVPWTGTGAVKGILGQAVPQGETAKRTIIARDAEVCGEDLEHVFPNGVTLAGAVVALAAIGIIVR